uniref:DNA-directed DNA polymerase n=1 Tax=Meloidogyne incognita TaxID=6306 RepID=A0A914NQA3_MELIC
MFPPPPKKFKNFSISNLLGSETNNPHVKKLGHETKFNRKFNSSKVSSKFLIYDLPNDPESLLEGIFQSTIGEALQESRQWGVEPDQLGCIISSQNLDSDVWIPVREITSNTIDSILNQFLKVAQSKKQDNGLLWGAPFLVSVSTIQRSDTPSRVHGRGRNSSSKQLKVNDKSLIKIRNDDNYCLFYSLVATFIYATCLWPKWKFYDYMHSRSGMTNRFKKDSIDLMESVGASFDKDSYDAEEWIPSVVEYWNLLNKGWASDLFGQPYCLSCETVYDKKTNHAISCKARCKDCSRVGPGFPCKNINEFFKHCSKCGKDFRNENCYTHHTTSNFCSSSKKCEKCGVIWDVKDNNRNGRDGHICSERYCTTCGSYHDPKRGCYIKPLVIKPTKAYRIVAFDFETMQYREGEKGKLPRVYHQWIYDCSVCGEHRTLTFSTRPFKNTPVDIQNVTEYPLEEFVSWIIDSTVTDTVAFSHFGGRFDMVLVFKELFIRGLTPDMIKKVISCIEMKVKVGKKNWVIFRDTFNLMPMSLASLVPAFALSVEDKPFFPHMVNRPENYGKEIFPVKDDYLADGMMPDKRA